MRATPTYFDRDRPVQWYCLALMPFVVVALMAAPANSKPTAENARAIEYIIGRVARSEIEFIRNGKEHMPDEAAKHMRKKYEHYIKRIDTPEDFIELAGTKSVLSGKPYMVREEGREFPAADWLHTLLADYRALANGEPPAGGGPDR